MLCESCNKRNATVHFTKIVNSSKVEIHLCEQCARQKKQLGFGSPININDFFSGIMSLAGTQDYPKTLKQEIVCSECGMSYEEFQKVGKFGCRNCYRIFGDKLNPLVKRLHGSIQHNGKVPEKVLKSIKATREIDSLKQMLSEAIKNEEYEKAAQIRDRIRDLEPGKE